MEETMCLSMCVWFYWLSVCLFFIETWSHQHSSNGTVDKEGTLVVRSSRRLKHIFHQQVISSTDFAWLLIIKSLCLDTFLHLYLLLLLKEFFLSCKDLGKIVGTGYKSIGVWEVKGKHCKHLQQGMKEVSSPALWCSLNGRLVLVSELILASTRQRRKTNKLSCGENLVRTAGKCDISWLRRRKSGCAMYER